MKEARPLLDRAAKYIAKGLEKGAYTETVGGDRVAERVLDGIRRYRSEKRPRSEETHQLLKRAIQYLGKGLAEGAYTTTAGGDSLAERLLDQLQALRDRRVPHATKKKSHAELDRDIAEALAKDYRVLVRVEGAPKPVHVSHWMTRAQAEHAAKNHKAMIRDRGWTQVVEIEDKSGAVKRVHSTKKRSNDVSVGDEVYAISGGRRHGPGIVEEIYDDGNMRVDFTRQHAGRLRVRPQDLVHVPRK